MLAKKITVKGRVQRVGYRRYVLENARALSLQGYVKNELDDSVTIHVQGEEDNINRFIDIISNPPKPALVESIDTKDANIENIEYFTIKYGELAEELQEGFGGMESAFYSYWNEFRSFANKTDSNFNTLKNEIKTFANKTDNNFNVLLNRYGEISDKLTRILEELKNDREEANNRFESLLNENKKSIELLANILDRLTR